MTPLPYDNLKKAHPKLQLPHMMDSLWLKITGKSRPKKTGGVGGMITFGGGGGFGKMGNSSATNIRSMQVDGNFTTAKKKEVGLPGKKGPRAATGFGGTSGGTGMTVGFTSESGVNRL
jgi:hypothetical protein